MSSPRRSRVVAVVGTRPNLMKTWSVLEELGRRRETFEPLLVHTGQHFDHAMSGIFFDELGLRPPDYTLDVGSGTHGEQTARVVERLEPLLRELQPDAVVVPGDVNSTLAAGLAAAQLRIPVVHLEAGLRSFDRSMPEELNRVLVDALADLHLTHSAEAGENLLREGIAPERIRFVGNTMIDTLVALRDRPEVASAPQRHGMDRGRYLLVTLHRPALVDSPLLVDTFARLDELAHELPVVFPVHPRTREALDDQVSARSRVLILPPLGYFDFLGLMAAAAGVLTDSGGVQEETTMLGVPCFTLRATTERPVTVELGTNTVLGLDPRRIAAIPELLREAPARRGRVPPLWDGGAAVRVVDALEQFLDSRSS